MNSVPATYSASASTDRIRAELAEMVATYNDDPPLCPVVRLLALDEIGRLRAALREAEGRQT